MMSGDAAALVLLRSVVQAAVGQGWRVVESGGELVLHGPHGQDERIVVWRTLTQAKADNLVAELRRHGLIWPARELRER